MNNPTPTQALELAGELIEERSATESLRQSLAALGFPEALSWTDAETIEHTARVHRAITQAGCTLAEFEEGLKRLTDAMRAQP